MTDVEQASSKSWWFETAPRFRGWDGACFVRSPWHRHATLPARFVRLRALVGTPCCLCGAALVLPTPDAAWADYFVLETLPDGTVDLPAGRSHCGHVTCPPGEGNAGEQGHNAALLRKCPLCALSEPTSARERPP